MKKPDLEKRPGFFIARVRDDDRFTRSQSVQPAGAAAQQTPKPAEAATNRQVT